MRFCKGISNFLNYSFVMYKDVTSYDSMKVVAKTFVGNGITDLTLCLSNKSTLTSQPAEIKVMAFKVTHTLEMDE